MERDRHLRAIGTRHPSGAVEFLSRSAVLEHAKRLGLTTGQMLVAESEEEMTLVIGLALDTAKQRRSRALDRYARATPLPLDSDTARMLAAMRHARFSIWRITHRHEPAGPIIADGLRAAAVWLIDEKLEASAPEGLSCTGCVCEPDRFAMTCGVIVPVNRDLMEEVALDMLAWRRGGPERVAEDPRFATVINRAALASGIMNSVVYE